MNLKQNPSAKLPEAEAERAGDLNTAAPSENSGRARAEASKRPETKTESLHNGGGDGLGMSAENLKAAEAENLHGGEGGGGGDEGGGSGGNGALAETPKRPEAEASKRPETKTQSLQGGGGDGLGMSAENLKAAEAENLHGGEGGGGGDEGVGGNGALAETPKRPEAEASKRPETKTESLHNGGGDGLGMSAENLKAAEAENLHGGEGGGGGDGASAENLKAAEAEAENLHGGEGGGGGGSDEGGGSGGDGASAENLKAAEAKASERAETKTRSLQGGSDEGGGSGGNGALAETPKRPEAETPKRPRATSPMRAYWALTKPRLSFFCTLTALIPYWSFASASLKGTLILGLGTQLAAGAAGALNQYLERWSDAKMQRTQQRPLITGALKAPQALSFGLLAALASTALLGFGLNSKVALLSVLTLGLYLLIYTPLKRKTHHNTLIGALPGAIPPLMGSAAATGQLEAVGWSLFGVLLLWQMPHFIALSWLYREDYSKAGFKMLCVVAPNGKRVANEAVFYTAALLLVSLLPVALGVLSLQLYGIAALALGGLFLKHAIGFFKAQRLWQASQSPEAAAEALPADPAGLRTEASTAQSPADAAEALLQANSEQAAPPELGLASKTHAPQSPADAAEVLLQANSEQAAPPELGLASKTHAPQSPEAELLLGKAAKKLFLYSLLYLPLICVAVLLDHRYLSS